jgi:hypothetical protein
MIWPPHSAAASRFPQNRRTTDNGASSPDRINLSFFCNRELGLAQCALLPATLTAMRQ